MQWRSLIATVEKLAADVKPLTAMGQSREGDLKRVSELEAEVERLATRASTAESELARLQVDASLGESRQLPPAPSRRAWFTLSGNSCEA